MAKASRSRVAPEAQYPPPRAAHEEIARLAYSLWQARGCPEGSAEEDWLMAEKQLDVYRKPDSTGNGER